MRPRSRILFALLTCCSTCFENFTSLSLRTPSFFLFFPFWSAQCHSFPNTTLFHAVGLVYVILPLTKHFTLVCIKSQLPTVCPLYQRIQTSSSCDWAQSTYQLTFLALFPLGCPCHLIHLIIHQSFWSGISGQFLSFQYFWGVPITRFSLVARVIPFFFPASQRLRLFPSVRRIFI